MDYNSIFFHTLHTSTMVIYMYLTVEGVKTPTIVISHNAAYNTTYVIQGKTNLQGEPGVHKI